MYFVKITRKKRVVKYDNATHAFIFGDSIWFVGDGVVPNFL